MVKAPVPPPSTSTPISPPLICMSLKLMIDALALNFSIRTPETALVLLIRKPVIDTLAESRITMASSRPPTMVPASPIASVVMPNVIGPPVLFSQQHGVGGAPRRCG